MTKKLNPEMFDTTNSNGRPRICKGQASRRRAGGLFGKAQAKEMLTPRLRAK